MSKKRKKQGFTLVEVIVVLVILAILAAILVPTMIGYIKKAEDKVAYVEFRAVRVSLQTLISHEYNQHENAGLADEGIARLLQNQQYPGDNDLAREFFEASGLKGGIGAVTIKDGKLYELNYFLEDGREARLSSGGEIHIFGSGTVGGDGGEED
ncbi:MAG: prepilin-type N-terminal cleavage/methylation domain-containing protein [Anaerovoracaceae bacterium]